MKVLSRLECIIFALISASLSSVATLFKVQGVASVPPLLAASVGVLFAGILTLLYLALRKRLPSWQAIAHVRTPLLQLIFTRSVISNLLFTIGLSMTTGIKAVFLTKMEPYLVIFWVWMLDGKRPSSKHLSLLALHIVGAILLSAGADLMIAKVEWGDLIILLAVVSAALSYRFVPKITKTLSATQTSALAETAGGMLTLPLALVLCPINFGASEISGWGYIGVHALLFYVCAVPLLYASLHGIEGWLSSALRAAGPLVALPIAWFAFGERLTAVQMLGALIVLVTSALISRAERSK